MNVLFSTRHDLLENPGGDTMQILKLKEDLERLDVNVTIGGIPERRGERFDLIHLFNLTRPYELWPVVKKASRQRAPVLLTPIYQNFDEWDEKGRIGIQRLFTHLVRKKNTKELIKNFFRYFQERKLRLMKDVVSFSHLNIQKRIISSSILLLTNSHLEYKQLFQDIGIQKPYEVIYNGVDPKFSEASPELFRQSFKIARDFVLCVANFSSIKNHLRFVQAALETPLAIVLIGNRQKHHTSYFKNVKRFVKEFPQKIHLIEGASQELIQSAYAAAKVHILASWFETCGLANLEAAVAGCNIVSTDRGYAREYFGDMAWYCDPSDPLSIRRAISEAWNAPKSDRLQKYILEHFTWKNAAQKTFEVYRKVLNDAS